jgi:DNA repair protein SbcD/Mre11
VRFLHTSDWHFGRQFHGVDLLSDQAAFVDWLADLVKVERIELVAVAGDLFDRAVPPPEAQRLLGECFARLRSAGAYVVAIAGNHDSAARVGAFEDVLSAGGVVLRGDPRRATEVIHLRFADGPLDVVAVPYVDAGLVSGRNSQAALEAVLAPAIAGIAAPRSIGLAHAFVTGGTPSDSERPLALGGTEMVAGSMFDGLSYGALGHLHRPQELGPRLHYSGSPLSYSFSEQHDKQVVIGDLAPDGSLRVQRVPIDVGRPVRTVRGTFDDACAGRIVVDRPEAFVAVELTDEVERPGAMDLIQRALPGAVFLRWVGRLEAPRVETLSIEQVTAASPIELAGQFWHEVTESPWSDAERAVLIDALGHSGLTGMVGS